MNTQPALPLDTDACERDDLRAAYMRHANLRHRYTFEAALRVPALLVCLRAMALTHRRKITQREHAACAA